MSTAMVARSTRLCPEPWWPGQHDCVHSHGGQVNATMSTAMVARSTRLCPQPLWPGQHDCVHSHAGQVNCVVAVGNRQATGYHVRVTDSLHLENNAVIDRRLRPGAATWGVTLSTRHFTNPSNSVKIGPADVEITGLIKSLK